MWVSSFVVTLPEDEKQSSSIVEAVEAVSVFEPGERCGRQWPLVLEAEDGTTARYWHRWVEDLKGVVSVDVAFVSFA